MTPLRPDQNQGIIRITREEGMSPHVDDLLKRQASLRGEGGIARDRKGKWYYQNWFVFMIAGMLSALAAWAIIEPYFDDMLYIQGPIQEMDREEPLSHRISKEGLQFELKVTGRGWIKLNGQKVWILSKAKFLRSDGTKGPVDLSVLRSGQAVGLYVVHEAYAQMGLSAAMFVVPDPPPNPPGKALMTLEALNARTSASAMLLFAVVAAFIGLAIGSVDGLVCRLPRRALLAGAVGLVVGFIGGFVFGLVANLAYTPITQMAMRQEGDTASGLSTVGFLVQMGGRALGWCLAGMAMGLGQGIALRSGRLLLYGLLGGVIGGLLGGLLFDPIHFFVVGADAPSGHWSRLIGLAMVGLGVGGMIGVVELLARDAWLRMVEGPLAGKEFLIFKDTMFLGSSPKSEIYLFNDDAVAPQHAVIRCVGDNYEMENLAGEEPATVNGRPAQRMRLRHGDQISIGRTTFVFQKRKT